MLEVERGFAEQVVVLFDAERELVGPRRRQADRRQRTRELALRVRGIEMLAAHAAAGSLTAHSTSERSSASRSRSPGSGTASLSANTTAAPRLRAVSATTSMPAALTSTR